MAKCCKQADNSKTKTSFFYKVLTSLKLLHTTKKHCNGASSDDIIRCMKARYCLSGDIDSQVVNALHVADEYHYVHKTGSQYSFVIPVATLQFIPKECVEEEIQRVFSIFENSHHKTPPSKCETDSSVNNCDCPPKKKSKKLKLCGAPKRKWKMSMTGSSVSIPCKKESDAEECDSSCSLFEDASKKQRKRKRKRKKRKSSPSACACK